MWPWLLLPKNKGQLWLLCERQFKWTERSGSPRAGLTTGFAVKTLSVPSLFAGNISALTGGVWLFLMVQLLYLREPCWFLGSFWNISSSTPKSVIFNINFKPLKKQALWTWLQSLAAWTPCRSTGSNNGLDLGLGNLPCLAATAVKGPAAAVGHHLQQPARWLSKQSYCCQQVQGLRIQTSTYGFSKTKNCTKWK